MSNNFSTTDVNGVTVTFKTQDVGGGVQSTMIIPSDVTGTPYSGTNLFPVTAPGLATSSNQTLVLASPGSNSTSALGVQGVSGGLPILVSGTVSVGNFPTTQAISATALPLPTGAATDANLTALVNAVKAQIDLASTLWTDNSGAFYVRMDSINEGTGNITITFVDPASGISLTPSAGLRPASTSSGRIVQQALYDVIVSGTGYSTGDIIGRIAVIDNTSTTPAIISSGWINLTTGMVLTSAPFAGSLVEQTQHLAITSSVLPTGASTAAYQLVVQAAPGSSSSAATGVQGVTNGVPVGVSGTVSVGNFPATQVVSGSGTFTVGGTVSVGNFPATQPVSGSVSVSNLPATQAVSGSVSVSNLPATQTVSGTITANLGGLNGAATAANQTAVISTAGSAALSVISVQGAANGTPVPININASSPDVRNVASITTNTLNNAATFALNNGLGTIGFSVSGLTAAGAILTIEASIDSGATWAAVNGVSVGPVYSQTVTVDGPFRVDVGGRTNVRLRVSTPSASAATVSVTISASRNSSVITPGGPIILGNSTNVVGKFGVDQTSPGTTNAVYDTTNAPITGVSVLTVGAGAATVGRKFAYNCTAAGNISVVFRDTSTLTFSATVGFATFPWAITQVVSSGTTATATYYNMN